jgi:preprotein translocase subunit Sec63
MEYMHLGWYIILCGRNGEGYDNSSCTWNICILADTLFCVGGMVRAMIAAPAHTYTPCAGAAIIALTIPPTQNNVPAKMHYFVWEEW